VNRKPCSAEGWAELAVQGKRVKAEEFEKLEFEFNPVDPAIVLLTVLKSGPKISSTQCFKTFLTFSYSIISSTISFTLTIK
jgi:hypothetical protein